MLVVDMPRNKCFPFPRFEYKIYNVLYPFVTLPRNYALRYEDVWDSGCIDLHIFYLGTSAQVKRRRETIWNSM
jgi:hypothetical protein